MLRGDLGAGCSHSTSPQVPVLCKQRHLVLGQRYEGYSSGVLSSVQTGCQAKYYVYCSSDLKTLFQRIKSAL